MPPAELDRIQRMLLLHLLEHHGQQVRFEASQWVTEFGIVRQFSSEPADAIRKGLRALEMGRLIYRRTQYVVGYSEPKHVFSLTPSGHRKAIEVREAADDGSGGAELPPPATPGRGTIGPDGPSAPSEGTGPTA